SCFFFQAEDGIRDSSVTGVQTCALPISFAQQTLQTIEVVGVAPVPGAEIDRDKVPSNVETIGARELDHSRAPSLLDNILRSVPRSEERRVGKEWRAGR